MSVATAAVSEQRMADEFGIDVTGRPVYVPGFGLSAVATVHDGTVGTVFGMRGLDEVVLLPRPGEWVEVAGGSAVRGCWLAALDAAGGTLTALLVEHGTVRQVRLDPQLLDARRVVRDADGAARAGLLDALVTESQAHALSRREHEEWQDRLVADLHQEAEDRDYCEAFDDFMEDHGLPRRSHDYDLRVKVFLTCSGTSLDEAISSVTRQDVLDTLTCSGSFEVEADD